MQDLAHHAAPERQHADDEDEPGDQAHRFAQAVEPGHAGEVGGGGKGDNDTIDFVAGTIDLLPAGGVGTIDVASPRGRYLMIQTSDYSTTCCGGASIWGVTVDTDPIPEPTSMVLAAMALAGLGLFGSRRRKSRS